MGNQRLRDITAQDYNAAWQKLYAAASIGGSTSPRAAGYMLALLSQAPAQVDIFGIAIGFDDDNLAAAITVLKGYARHRNPDWINGKVVTELRAVAARDAA
ncbi:MULTISPECIES: hypothetical protein [Roseobacteraceae]|uniref:hypothetical protein n=1 Tax=Roseobacteraceae TaxID=2854170 RepID=UPI0031D69F9C